MLRSLSFLILTSASCVFLTSCDKTREALGLERNTPDEFTVQPGHGLVVPPNLAELPTPTPGSFAPHQTSPKDQARNAVLQDRSQPKATQYNDKSPGELAVLQKAGALDQREPNIRQTVDQEARVENKQEDSLIKDILSIDKKHPGKVINPQEENERLTGKQLPSDTKTSEAEPAA